jgi:hypothetical protein
MKPARTAELTHAAPLDAGAGAHRRRSCCSMSAACVEACGATMTGGKEKAAPVRLPSQLNRVTKAPANGA